MHNEPYAVLDDFERVRVLVVGEAMLDSYLQGISRRLCPEAPVPVVDVTERQDLPGGAANTAVNVAAMGGRVQLLSVIGDDCEGRLLLDALARQGVETEGVIVRPERQTLSKQRVLASSQLLVRFDQGTTTPLEGELEQAFLDRLENAFLASDVVIISDYAYGILTPAVLDRLAELQAREPRVLLADAKNLAAYQHVGLTAIKPNYTESLNLLGLTQALEGERRVEQILRHGSRVLELTGARIAALTIDVDGAVIFERGDLTYRTYARREPNSKASGAGDTFLSALGLALAAGASTPTAAEIASAAAEVVVRKSGTSTCTLDELRCTLAASEKQAPNAPTLAALVQEYRRAGKRIVLTNGCFDILHRGHVTYLNQAKALGDVLIVGVNCDETIRRLKGPERPINSLDDRMQVLAALSSIDHLVAFEEDTPCELIRALRPDVFVKGGDYTRESLPEAALVEELGGKVTILPYLDNRSTTKIIHRIRRATPEGTPIEIPGAETPYDGHALANFPQTALHPAG